jgi:putative methyltransferase (TIGR04325 family)
MRFIKEYIPPILLKKIISLFYGWRGNFNSWEEAQQKCTGYDTQLIFNKVRESIYKVKTGEAVYERDSVIFDKIQYSFQLLASLYHIALKNNNQLSILDFGGSLGSSYFQNRQILNSLNKLDWNVVEQSHFVLEGINSFSEDNLSFYYDIESCLKTKNINVILLSSVIQYIEKPYEFLNYITEKKIEFIIIDRAPVLLKGKDRISIQKVPKHIYQASYPCWLLNEKNILDNLFEYYDLIFEDTLKETIHINNASYKFYFFKLK